jgi:hypothetical protein
MHDLTIVGYYLKALKQIVHIMWFLNIFEATKCKIE